MAKGMNPPQNPSDGWAHRAKLAAEESLKRLQRFSRRRGRFVASAQKAKQRGVSA
jgi:hypothetical protein